MGHPPLRVRPGCPYGAIHEIVETLILKGQWMVLKLLPTFATRLLCALFCADFLTMLLMNTGRIYTHWLPLLYFLTLAAVALPIFRGSLIPPVQADYLTPSRRRQLAMMALLAGCVLAGVRLPYLMEGHFHHLVGPIVYDDTWHFQEINSLVHSVRYPAQCSLIPSRYFSLYYAPWMLIAALYLAIPVSGFTIKAAFAIGCAIYQLLICLTLLYLGMRRARSVRHLYWSIYFIVFWAGLESLFSLTYYLQRNPYWLQEFGTPIHLPIFFSGIVWAPHHMTAAISLILCWQIWETAPSKSWSVVGCCSLLIAYAFYSSVFVFLGALPIALFLTVLAFQRHHKAVLSIACLSSALIWPLLWIYFGKSHDIRFLFPFIQNVKALFPAMQGQHLSLPHHSALVTTILGGMFFGFIVFLIFICLNFGLHVFSLVYSSNQLDWKTLTLTVLAGSFILSTYFIGFPEGDNYASRGYIVPIFVLGWICAGLLPPIRIKSWAALGLFLGAFGLVHEGFQTYKHTLFIAETPFSVPYGQEILRINRDRHTRTASSAAISKMLQDDPQLIYYIEKFVDGGKTDLAVGDRQLECAGPNGPWRWQRIPEVPAR